MLHELGTILACEPLINSMEGIKHCSAFLTFISGVTVTVCGFYCLTTFSQQVGGDKTIRQNSGEVTHEKDDIKRENYQPDCLNAKYPKRKYAVYAGVLNAKALDIPKPKYPVKASRKKIGGDVNASVFIDESGKVAWARVDNGNQLLQQAARKVVCKALFNPATISGNPYSFRGLITYRFVP